MQFMRRLTALSITILALPVAATQASAQVRDTSRAPTAIQLSGEYTATDRPSIAVQPFAGSAGTGVAPDSMATIIRRDLEYSDLLVPASVPPNLVSATPDYRALNSLNIDYLVTGEVQLTGGGYQLALTVHDVVYGRVKDAARYRLPALTAGDFRMAVHSLSDEIVRGITNRPGFAASRVALTRQNKATASRATGSYDLLVVDADGFGLRRLSGNTGQIYSPTWSPDGSKLAYAFNAGATWQLIERDMETSRTRTVTSMKNLTTPTYSPDGSRIAFAGWVEGNGFEIYDYDINRNCCRRLIASSQREDQAPSYSADGSRIAFMSDRLGQPHIYIADTNGGRATLLSPFVSGMRGYYFSPDWAPNSSKIVFSGHWNSRGVYQIMVADATRPGGAIDQLTSSGDNEDPSWAPDGRHIVFSSGVGDQQLSLYVIDAVTKKRRLLTGGTGKLRMSDWSPILAKASDYVVN